MGPPRFLHGYSGTLPLVVFTLFLGGSCSEQLSNTTQKYQYEEVLSAGKYVLYWDYNSTHITLETHVNTTGWVGIGISPNGDMSPADVAIGWVKDGKPHFHDRHTTGNYEPLIDRYQSWHLIHGREENGVTIIKSVRALEACDEDDLAITGDLAYVIWSFSDVDPNSNTGLSYHMTNRGSAQIYLLDPPSDNFNLTDDMKFFDITSLQFAVPSQVTRYQHTWYVVPPLGEKHHVVRFEAIIQKENLDILHHFILYVCDKPFKEANATTADMARKGNPCYRVYMTWALGGKVYNLPDDVGVEIGGEDSTYFVIEVHYNNPQRLSGRIDSSGMRVIYTPNLRRYDAGAMQIGSDVSDVFMIPPYEPAFRTYGACSPMCTQAIGNTSINVFAVGLHSHLIAKQMTLRIDRDGQELKPLMSDENYNYNFQQMRMLRNFTTVEPGDRLVTECIFDSTERTEPTLGGLSSKEEMCLAFVMYYPKTSLISCGSVPTYNFTRQYLQSGLLEMREEYDWSDPDVRKHFDDLKETSYHMVHCNIGGRKTVGELPPITFDNPYTPLAPHVCTDFDIYNGATRPGTLSIPLLSTILVIYIRL